MNDEKTKVEICGMVVEVVGLLTRPCVTIESDSGTYSNIACTLDQAVTLAGCMRRKVRITIEPVE